ncbi:hypothetical protein FXV91_11240 [Methanosarcina sp. DH2]|jgi:hypothetical protein|uniref:hypothetical protein n=1 Tax=Methanosarcina sp. DH2 TaxID=2605639 RepID=UPI001E42E17D|nr:hypothetical protein [Methanosarcina sp. DH2]MCC4770732.1 hypothetical protein [Methanosarcina sp. DH2]
MVATAKEGTQKAEDGEQELNFIEECDFFTKAFALAHLGVFGAIILGMLFSVGMVIVTLVGLAIATKLIMLILGI